MKLKSLTPMIAGLSMFVWIAQAQSSSVARITIPVRDNLTHVLSEKKTSEMPLAQLQSEMLAYINTIRTQHGLQPFTLYHHPIAQDHSVYLSTSKKDTSIDSDDHYGPGEESILTRVENAKIPVDTDCRWDCKRASENLASANMTIKQTVDMWMQSTSGHAQNILSSSFDAIAIWCAPGGNNVVVIFLNLK